MAFGAGLLTALGTGAGVASGGLGFGFNPLGGLLGGGGSLSGGGTDLRSLFQPASGARPQALAASRQAPTDLQQFINAMGGKKGIALKALLAFNPVTSVVKNLLSPSTGITSPAFRAQLGSLQAAISPSGSIGERIGTSVTASADVQANQQAAREGEEDEQSILNAFLAQLALSQNRGLSEFSGVSGNEVPTAAPSALGSLGGSEAPEASLSDLMNGLFGGS